MDLYHQIDHQIVKIGLNNWCRICCKFSKRQYVNAQQCSLLHVPASWHFSYRYHRLRLPKIKLNLYAQNEILGTPLEQVHILYHHVLYPTQTVSLQLSNMRIIYYDTRCSNSAIVIYTLLTHHWVSSASPGPTFPWRIPQGHPRISRLRGSMLTSNQP